MEQDPGFDLLIRHLQKTHGFDFSQYRSRCLKRRVQSRMHACSCDTHMQYMAYLRTHPEEYRKLIDALTINVTEFFRNPETFQYVERHVLPAIIEAKRAQRHMNIRVWSAGCSTGVEAYSLAILFHEILGRKINDFVISINGTDIDEGCLHTAKTGEYSAESLKEVPAEIVDRYFVAGEDGYAVSDGLRRLMRFRRHDLVQDKPLLLMDLVVCRNVFIYFSRDLQASILKKFHQALSRNGYLILGKTENMATEFRDAFETVNTPERIFRKVE